MPTAGKRVAGDDDPAVYVDEELDVDTVPAVLASQQVAAVAPVEGRDQCPVDQAYLAGQQVGQVVVGTGERLGEEADHLRVVVPGGRASDPEILVEVVVGGVAPQPAHRQSESFGQGQAAGAADRLVPVGELLLGQFDHEGGCFDAEARQAVH